VTQRALALAVLVVMASCGKPEPSSDGPASSGQAVAAATASTPADHLAPGELVEGTQQAFGLTLPRGVTVDTRLPNVVNASGPVAIKPLVTYLRERLEGGSVSSEELATRFVHVKPRGQPGPVLDLYIAPTLGKTLLQVSTEPEVAPSTLPDEPSRWRAVGLTPDGKLLDPTRTE